VLRPQLLEALEEFIVRALQSKDGAELIAALKVELPTITIH
jgi:hypothetical protein